MYLHKIPCPHAVFHYQTRLVYPRIATIATLEIAQKIYHNNDNDCRLKLLLRSERSALLPTLFMVEFSLTKTPYIILWWMNLEITTFRVTLLSLAPLSILVNRKRF